MSSDNTITALRTHLFQTLEMLKDKEKPLEIERAKAISDVAQTIINSAKAEVDYLRITGGKGSGFIPEAPAKTLPKSVADVERRPGVTITRHQLT